MGVDLMISVVIPVYNEKACLGDGFRRVHGVLQGVALPFEIIMVDDGSTDGTWQEIEALVQCCPEARGVRLSRNFGKELAICAGLDEVKGKAAILMDADMQHPPELIPEMIRYWRDEQYEVVEAVKQDRGNESVVSKACAHVFYRIMEKLSGIQLIGASDFKLLDERALDAWRRMGERNVFFRGMSAWIGFRRKQLGFEVQERQAGESKWSQWSLLRLALDAIVSFSTVPLRVVMVSGLLFFLFAIVMGVNTVYQFLAGEAVTGFSTVILLLLIVSSLMMLALGVIGEYLSKIYEEVKGRPRYVVADRCESSHGT